MSRRQRRWERLQSRWASGELLSADEERERLEYAALDPAAERELELFAELRARAKSDGAPASSALIDDVLDTIQGRPRLRLVAPSERRAAASVAGPHPARPQRTLAIAAALVAVAALGVTLLAMRSTAVAPAPAAKHPAVARAPALRAVLVLSAGRVSVDARPATVGQGPLHEGQRVATGDGGACLTIASDIDVCLGANSTLQLQSLAAQTVRLRVESGTALATLKRRAAGSSFSLVMDEVSATALGTTFAARRERGETEVIVLEGTVDVVRGSERLQRVDAQSRLLVRSADGAFERLPVAPEEQARLLALGSWRESWTGEPLGVLQLSAVAPGLRASIDEQPPLPLPLQAVVRAGKRRVTWRDAAGDQTSGWLDVAAGETQRVEPPPPRVAAAPPEEPARKATPAELLEAARRELGSARPREALALYERLRLVYPDSTEARTVLVTMGKLELKLGRPERALRHFDAYLGQGGALSPEALAGKIRALRSLGRLAEERAAIRQYLARHPRGLEGPLFESRLRELDLP